MDSRSEASESIQRIREVFDLINKEIYDKELKSVETFFGVRYIQDVNILDVEIQAIQILLNTYWDFEEFYEQYMATKSLLFDSEYSPNVIKELINGEDLPTVPAELRRYLTLQMANVKRDTKKRKLKGTFNFKVQERKYRKKLTKKWFEYTKANPEYRSVLHFYAYGRLVFKQLHKALKVRKPTKPLVLGY